MRPRTDGPTCRCGCIVLWAACVCACWCFCLCTLVDPSRLGLALSSHRLLPGRVVLLSLFRWRAIVHVLLGRCVILGALARVCVCCWCLSALVGPSFPGSALSSHRPLLAGEWCCTVSLSPNRRAIARVAQALLELYRTTNGAHWTNRANWLDSSRTICEYYGISCNKQGNVTEISLPNNGLVGTLPAALGTIGTLEDLHLPQNQLWGTVPTEIMRPSLLNLQLWENSLQGSLPSEVGLVSNIQVFDVRTNGLHGAIPTEFGLLTKAAYISLHTNNFEGALPSQLGKLGMKTACFLTASQLAAGDALDTNRFSCPLPQLECTRSFPGLRCTYNQMPWSPPPPPRPPASPPTPPNPPSLPMPPSAPPQPPMLPSPPRVIHPPLPSFLSRVGTVCIVLHDTRWSTEARPGDAVPPKMNIRLGIADWLGVWNGFVDTPQSVMDAQGCGYECVPRGEHYRAAKVELIDDLNDHVVDAFRQICPHPHDICDTCDVGSNLVGSQNVTLGDLSTRLRADVVYVSLMRNKVTNTDFTEAMEAVCAQLQIPTLHPCATTSFTRPMRHCRRWCSTLAVRQFIWWGLPGYLSMLALPFAFVWLVVGGAGGADLLRPTRHKIIRWIRHHQAEEVAAACKQLSIPERRQLLLLRVYGQIAVVCAILTLPLLPAVLALRPSIALARTAGLYGHQNSLLSLRRRWLLKSELPLTLTAFLALLYGVWLLFSSANLLPPSDKYHQEADTFFNHVPHGFNTALSWYFLMLQAFSNQETVCHSAWGASLYTEQQASSNSLTHCWRQLRDCSRISLLQGIASGVLAAALAGMVVIIGRPLPHVGGGRWARAAAPRSRIGSMGIGGVNGNQGQDRLLPRLGRCLISYLYKSKSKYHCRSSLGFRLWLLAAAAYFFVPPLLYSLCVSPYFISQLATPIPVLLLYILLYLPSVVAVLVGWSVRVNGGLYATLYRAPPAGAGRNATSSAVGGCSAGPSRTSQGKPSQVQSSQEYSAGPSQREGGEALAATVDDVELATLDDSFDAVREPQAVVGKFVGNSGDLVYGDQASAATGIFVFMQVDENEVRNKMMTQGVDAMRDEWAPHGTPEDVENLEYVLMGEAGSSDIRFHEGWQRDRTPEGHPLLQRVRADGCGFQLQDFVQTDEAIKAHLDKLHVAALRLYTTSAFHSINEPLRQRLKDAQGELVNPPQLAAPYPLPVTLALIHEGLRRLRAVAADQSMEDPARRLARSPSALIRAMQTRQKRRLDTKSAVPRVAGSGHWPLAVRAALAAADSAGSAGSAGPTGSKRPSLLSRKLPIVEQNAVSASSSLGTKKVHGVVWRGRAPKLPEKQRRIPRIFKVLYRGMRDLKVDKEFLQNGGTELAALSTTDDLGVAVQYARAANGSSALIFRIVVTNAMQLGIDLRFVSAFPHECEFLYPPLTVQCH